jgi:hypothetical protein
MLPEATALLNSFISKTSRSMGLSFFPLLNSRRLCWADFLISAHQDILNKIEFFPIKCRIQNASENFHKYQKELEEDKESWWSSSEYMSTQRTKVHLKNFHVIYPLSLFFAASI